MTLKADEAAVTSDIDARTPEMERAMSICEYWFDGLDNATVLSQHPQYFRRWFGKDQETDQEIRERFEGDYLRATRGEYEVWLLKPRGRVALVLLFDQFPRNMYRGTSKAFATDHIAVKISLRSIAHGVHNALSLIEQMFLYMPLMHAESLGIQEQALHYFGLLVELAKERSPANVEYFAESYRYGQMHYDIIKRFGHFPHRNEILGRASTPEEIEFLKEPGSSF